jgi:putative ubiquitin-RnfH superfamily antitoxin RatB of RatAB toxin-antitoxin module
MVEDKKEVTEKRTIVVSELPKQELEEVTLQTGETVKVLTLLDAITEMYKDIKDIKAEVGAK